MPEKGDRAVDAGTAGDLARLLAGVTPPLEVVIGDQTGVIEFLPRHRWPRGVDLYACLALTLDGGNGHLFLPPGLLALLHDAIAPGLSRRPVAGPVAGLLVEAAIAPLLDGFEEVAGCRVAITGLVPRADASDLAGAINFGFKVAIPGAPPYLIAAALPGDWSGKLLSRWLRARDHSAKETELVVRAGWTVVDEPFNDLEADDVVVLSRSALASDRLLVVIGDAVCATAEITEEGVVLEDAPAQMETSFMKSLARPVGCDTAGVVVCDALRQTISIDDALGLKAGSLIKLPHGLTGPVEMRADTGRGALGRLVRVGARPGVRLMERPRAAV